MSAPVTRAFETAAEHPQEIQLRMTGAVPQQLRGTLYRNGPARWDVGGFHAGHLFDGDGLVTKFVIDNGAVRFRSRYVRTPKFVAEEAGTGARLRGLYTNAAGILRTAGRLPADTANTNAVVHGGRLICLSDAGRPWEVDLHDLTTIGQCTFDGRLPRLTRFSPHPRIDPITGELFNFGLDFAPSASARTPLGLRCYRVDSKGRLSTIAVVPLKHALIQHDFAITEHYLVFALAPITADPLEAALALAGLRPLGDAAAYRPEQGMKIVLVPRAGGPLRTVECDPFTYVHVDNAYEDGGDVVLDVVRHESFEYLFENLKSFREGFALPSSWPTRLHITAGGRVLLEETEFDACEFPTHDERRTGRKHRYTYLSAIDGAGVNAIAKVDRVTGQQRRHVFAPGVAAGEPLFVPRSDTAAEDAGWIMVLAYVSAEHRTDLIILDATNIEQVPLAIAHLDDHIFPGFHGTFTPQIL